MRGDRGGGQTARDGAAPRSRKHFSQLKPSGQRLAADGSALSMAGYDGRPNNLFPSCAWRCPHPRQQFNPVRIGFAWDLSPATFSAASSASTSSRLTEVWTRDVLNLGVRPDALVQLMRAKLEAAGGAVIEQAALAGACV